MMILSGITGAFGTWDEREIASLSNKKLVEVFSNGEKIHGIFIL